MSGLTTHSGLPLVNLNTHRGLAALVQIDGMAVAVDSTPGAGVYISDANSGGKADMRGWYSYTAEVHGGLNVYQRDANNKAKWGGAEWYLYHEGAVEYIGGGAGATPAATGWDPYTP